MITRTIYKYPLTRLTTLELYNPKVVHVGMQGDEAFVWIEQDLGFANTKLTLLIIGTGHQVPEAGVEHVGTFMDGPYVWHVYKRQEDL